ncbi:hypothetical protein [Sorangium sp. So ce341]|uniref:hypothetical protein n=1 Tax=Sorangium sp. So ce341 TaxID=3133302 RepID=UPI003F614A0C
MTSSIHQDALALSRRVFAPRFAAFAREPGAATLPDDFAASCVEKHAPRLGGAPSARRPRLMLAEAATPALLLSLRTLGVLLELTPLSASQLGAALRLTICAGVWASCGPGPEHGVGACSGVSDLTSMSRGTRTGS